MTVQIRDVCFTRESGHRHSTARRPHFAKFVQCLLFFQKRTSAQRFNELPKLHRFIRSGPVSIIAIPVALRRATASAVHSADPPSPDRRRAARLAAPFRCRRASWCTMSFLHEVVAHFSSGPPPSSL